MCALEGVLLLWRGAKFVFWRGYFCCGGGGVFELEGYSTIYALEGIWVWGVINAKIRIHNIFFRGYFCCGGGGVFLSGGLQSLCLGESTQTLHPST